MRVRSCPQNRTHSAGSHTFTSNDIIDEPDHQQFITLHYKPLCIEKASSLRMTTVLVDFEGAQMEALVYIV